MNTIIKRFRTVKFSLLVTALLLVATSGSAQDPGADAGSNTSYSTFAWMKQNIQFYDAARFRGVPIRELLEKTIIEELETKGLRFSSSGTSANLLVAYTLVLEDTADDAEIETLYEAEPELRPLEIEDRDFEEGLLLLKIVNANTREQVWKRMIRGIAALEMPEDIREARTRSIVHELLSTYEP
jgi:uncharacterized membrane-anchored protein